MREIIQATILFILLSHNLAGQSYQKTVPFNKDVEFSVISTNYWNDSMSFSILRKNSIRIENFKYQLKDFEYEEIIDLIKGLDDENIDWACNLILYQLANRESILLFSLATPYIDSKTYLFKSEIELIQIWREYDKKDDKEYWSKWLSSKYSLKRS